jgi:hypothetical protein
VIVDLDPVAVRILHIRLPEPVAADADLAHISRPVIKRHALGRDIGDKSVEVIDAQREMRVLGQMCRAKIALDQMDRVEAADRQPSHIGAAASLDRGKAEDIGVESDAAIDTPTR